VLPTAGAFALLVLPVTGALLSVALSACFEPHAVIVKAIAAHSNVANKAIPLLFISVSSFLYYLSLCNRLDWMNSIKVPYDHRRIVPMPMPMPMQIQVHKHTLALAHKHKHSLTLTLTLAHLHAYAYKSWLNLQPRL
jgi:hypothetical protein